MLWSGDWERGWVNAVEWRLGTRLGECCGVETGNEAR